MTEAVEADTGALVLTARALGTADSCVVLPGVGTSPAGEMAPLEEFVAVGKSSCSDDDEG